MSPEMFVPGLFTIERTNLNRQFRKEREGGKNLNANIILAGTNEYP